MPRKTRPEPEHGHALAASRVPAATKNVMAKPTATSSERVLRDLERDDLRGDRGADVGAHDDADRLASTVMSPAETKPTTSTVVTDEDWITAVTKAPVRTPIQRLRGQAREEGPHAIAGDRLERVRYLLAAVEEEGQTAEEPDDQGAPRHLGRGVRSEQGRG